MNQSTSEGLQETKEGGHGPGGKGDDQLPIFKKYAHKGVQNWLDPSIKLKPSDLEKPSLNVSADDYPMIIEFNNLQDNSSQVRSTVDIDQPLFQPAPKVVIFKDYAPFATHEKKLYFRNNDSVARRIKIVQPATAFFELSAPRLSNGEPLRSSAIAAGMEIYFIVKFKPQEVRDYSWDLICNTEREKFIVPMRAIGMKPRITFPDEVQFGFCPVKSAMRKVMLVQNVGSAVAEFTMRSLNKCFTVSGEEMSMEPGSSLMIEVFFTPPTADHVEGEMEVEFNKGPKCYIAVNGAGKNVQVSLSTPSVALEPSYISLASQSIVRIKNMSEIPINFKWKSFSREEEEEVERSRLLLEIDRMEEIERSALMRRIQDGYYNTSQINEDGEVEPSMDEYDDNVEGIPFEARAEDASLVRKYRNLRRALEIDDMLFVDDIFEVTPSEGQVWANSEMEITVSFRPDTAAQFSCFSYLDVSGREDRLPLNIAGQGIGPHATLSFDVLDVGDVFINDEQRYEVSIVNKGDIAAHWQFMSSLTRFGSKFRFSPTEGSLEPGESQNISIVFESDVLGEFSENFRFNLQGNEDMLVCQIKGHVVGPTFHFDCSNIDFGIVSYDYLHESKLRLVNSSKIAMIFNLHVPQDGTYLKKEFNVEPCEGTLEPGQHMDILLEFIPSSVKVYDYSLVVDVLGVGDVLLSVPISAECVVVPVELTSREIDFGECFIRYPYEKEFTMNNVSDIVHTKFEVLPQQDFTKATATFEAEPAIAVIEPSDSMSITIRLIAEKLGSFKIPILIQTAGSQEPPQTAVLSFTVVGPKIKVDQFEVRWGQIECLKDSTRLLKITNDSLIMASIKLFLKNARSKFELGTRELTLEPYEEYDLPLTANLDDSVLIKEEVHLIIEESENVMVPLSAKGIGTTMYSADDLSTLNLGTQLTNTHFERRIVLENKGRRPQFLRWVNKTCEEDNASREEGAKKMGKESAGRTLPKNLQPREPVFTVALEEITLRPRTATTFVFKGKCDAPGVVTETFVLESRVGKERVMKPIIECNVTAEIINPLLEFSEAGVSYEYKWARGEDENRLTQQRDITLTNVTSVPLSFVLKTEVPFNLSSFEYMLQPQEQAELTLDFDPLYRDDKQSHEVDKKLTIAYRGHHQRDHIQLNGDIIFPNLDFETKSINFGCVLNESTKFVKVRVTNTSKVVASYSWCFLDEQNGNARAAPGRKHSSDHQVVASQLVDICPIQSVLEPGESELVEFSMFGQADCKFVGQLLCLVEGGPEYKLSLQGEASAMAFSLEQAILDFGKVTFTESAELEFAVKNTGKVVLPYSVEPATPEAAQLLDVKLPKGKIAAGETLRVPVVVYPAVPDNIVQKLILRVAHFDPVEITCYCQVIFPTAVVGLPRYRKLGPYNETDGNFNQLWADFVSAATSHLQAPDSTMLPPMDGELPPPVVASSDVIPTYVPPMILPPPASDMSVQEGGSVSSAQSVKAPPQIALEVEMTRLTMGKVMTDMIAEARARLAREAEEAKLNPALVEEPAATVAKGGKMRKPSMVTNRVNSTAIEEPAFNGLQSFIQQHVPMTSVIAGNYVCDFGNVVLGQSKKKVFKVTNASLAGQLNWNFDTTRISANGFTIEPFKAQKLVESDVIDFTVKFTARSSAKLGKKQCSMPLESKGSPSLMMYLQATICLPDVELSTDSLDFGNILVGQAKKMYLRLHNTSPVTSTWSMKPSRGDRTYTVTPANGSLRSGKKQVVCVEFIPSAIGKAACNFTIKVDNNKTNKTLSCSGEGLGVNLKWDQPSMELGPIIPYSDGDERVVTLSNNSEFDVEFFSLDFDPQHIQEESDMGALDIYDFEEFYRTNVRRPGEALSGDLQAAIADFHTHREEEAAALAADAAAAAAAAAAEEGGEEEKTEETAPTEGSVVDGEGSTAEAEAEPEEVWPEPVIRSDGEVVPRKENTQQDIIVVGPPLSGVSTMSRHLAKKLSLEYGKFDDVLRAVAGTGGDLGSTARRCLGTMSAREKIAVDAKEVELREAAEASKTAVEEAFKADKKNKGKEIEPEMLFTDEVSAYDAFMASGSLTADTAASIIAYRLSWADAAWGFVFDSLVSDYASEAILLKAFEKALPKAVLASMTTSGGQELYEQRIAQLHEDTRREVRRLTKAIATGHKEREKLHLLRLKKGKKGAAVTAAAALAAQANAGIKYAVPYGDEPWVVQEPGLALGSVFELDPQGVKALEDNQKIPYYNHVLWHQTQLLRESKTIVQKIERLWSASKGLFDPEEIRAAAAAEAEAAAVAAAAEAEAAAAAEAGDSGDEKKGEEAAPAEDAPADADDAAAAGADATGEEGGDVDTTRPGTATTEPTPELDIVQEEEIVLERVVYYQDYIRDVLPVVMAAFTAPPASAEEPIEGEEGAEGVAAEASPDADNAAAAPAAGEEATAAEVEGETIKDTGVFEISLEGEEDAETVFNTLQALLPAPKVAPEDKDRLPSEELFQLIRKPYARAPRRAIRCFEVLRVDPVDPEEEARLEAERAAKEEEAAAAAAAAKGKKGGAEPEEEVEPEPEVPVSYRWVVKGNDSVQLKVRFRATQQTRYDASLAFEVMGTQQQFSLHVSGYCEVPKINTDSRNVFMRRVKGVPSGAPPPLKRFVINQNHYSFGPQLIYKQADWKALADKPEDELSDEERAQLAAIMATNTDLVRVTNDGRFKCSVDLGLEDTDEASAGVFMVEPPTLELEEGETKDVRVWSFPKEVGMYSNALLACVTNNPEPMRYELKSWGVEPTIDIEGPWADAIAEAEKEVAECADKKLLKELEDKLAALKASFTFSFDRQLVNKTESKSFTIFNTCQLPVAWEFDLGDFKESENVEIVPSAGTIPVGSNVVVTVSFTSPTPLVLEGGFKLRFSDTESGLESTDRVGEREFKVNSEAYDIQTVTLNAEGQEEGGSSIDYGILRVGDYGTQSLKIANKGKYQIGYKFLVKGAMSNLMEIDVPEGTIEADGTEAEIKLTFCSKELELVLKNNKDIRVQISEPLSGEVVETFPLHVSADARFNRFRLQPSKGVTFGAVRFDAEAKTKRVELRNESKFDFTYVICTKSAEVDELDELDAAALACYAHATPAAMRVAELGENFKERCAGGGGGGGKGGKGGKGAPAATGDLWNPLVHDPDELEPGALPDDPLTLGAFTVTPRIGTCAPGEVIGIDVKFDPNGCDVARERVRMCISGIDPNHQSSRIIRSFELTGESCFPALLNSDNNSIFEEQEVVESLSEAIPDGGAANLERLPVGKVVYAENDKLLAYGPVMCGNSGTKGVMERIRITNPTKIDTKVRFKITPPGGGEGDAAAAAKGGKSGKGAPAAGDNGAASGPFTVHPELWDIPPHEHRFVNIYFNPLEIKNYRSVFMAEVDYEGSESTAGPKAPGTGKTLTFDLAGSGTLPCIAIEEPTERAEDGTLPIDFSRVHINKVSKRKVSIRNDGVMPATCLFQCEGDGEFLFPYSSSSLTVEPGKKEDITVCFKPTNVEGDGVRNYTVKVSVLNNAFDNYTFKMSGTAYACDATLDTGVDPDDAESVAQEEYDDEGKLIEKESEEDFTSGGMDTIKFKPLNLSEGPASCTREITVKSRSGHPLKFELSPAEGTPDNLIFSPRIGHLAPNGSRKVTITFSASEPVKLDAAVVDISLKRIEYKPNPAVPEEERKDEDMAAEEALWGRWDDSMKSSRLATNEDLETIKAAEEAMAEYLALKAAEEAKGKKGKDPGPPPAACALKMGEPNEEGEPTVEVTYNEPYCEEVEEQEPQAVKLGVNAVADIAKYSCQYDSENIPFKPTYLFQCTTHTFTFNNECNIKLPVSWTFDDIKHRTATARVGTAMTNKRNGTAPGTRGGTALAQSPANIPCPFFVEPEEAEVAPNSSKTFTLRFQPLDADDFVYALKGLTLPSLEAPVEGEAPTEEENGPNFRGPIRIVTRGTAKRPVCHFEIAESKDYLAKREPNLKNEHGLMAPIEATDLRVVAMESTGLRTRNTFRFHIINPTSDNFEFLWESVGEPSAYWRCVQSSGMLFGGKRVEVVFEYLPEETNTAESFFKFRLPKVGLEQMFLFSGHVTEPRVFFSTSRLDFHSVMLRGEGMNETVWLENREHLPFNFQFDKLSLLQLDGSQGPILDISPKSGTVAPHGKTPISFHFRPQEEVTYNYNIVCDVKRKPNKLSINVKGEGYSVHPQLMLELSEEQMHASASDNRFLTLKPRPAVNYADFGAVKVLDTVTKKVTVANNGKYNFDYIWDIEHLGDMLSLAGGKLGGTLHKGEEAAYTLTFAPTKEASLDGSSLSFTVAGKYVFDIYARGVAQQPALRFSFMQYDFGNCFVTSPGGQTVIEETTLRIVNHDPTSNISVECNFQKTRALWAECPPTVLEPGATLDVPIRFAPRDVKDYTFVIPFIVNGTSKVPVTVLGKGINARLELVNASQRRLPFGNVNVGSEVRKIIPIINKSKKALSVQIVEDSAFGQSAFDEKCVTVFPRNEIVIAPRESLNLQVSFGPNKRISNFSEDINVKYAGVTRKLVTLSGKGQGMEVSLDTDSLPFGNVVVDSAKVKKLSLENSGDMAIAFSWMEASFGKHFNITPLQGKVQPNSEMTFDVTFRPQEIDDDIRQDGMILQVNGMSPINLTCTGACINQPDESTQTLEFESIARKKQDQSIKFTNPTDKDWYLTPSLDAVDWTIANEFKVPAKGSSDLVVSYFPLTMRPKPSEPPAEGEPDPAHTGKLFVALPDGTAQLYRLRGFAGPPECSGVLEMETSAKKPANIGVKLTNWLRESQQLKVTVDLTEKPSPATFIVAANAVEIGAGSTKEFPIRFMSYTEGTTKGTITFTNPSTGEYAYYELVAKATMPEVLEEIAIESCVRQSAKYVVLLENPLPAEEPVDMDCHSNDDWWTCDSDCVRVKELTPLNGATEGSFEVEYRPLAVTTEAQEHLLSITSKELGTYKYKLRVTATPPPLPQSLRFEVPLGSVQAETFTFKAFNAAKLDYACSTKKPDLFNVNKTISVDGSSEWEGQSMHLAVSFEPTEMGTIHDTLTITAAGGIEYVCEIIGNCVPPMPQGPYELSQGGGNVDIPFRNYFPSGETWSFSTDTPAFVVAGTSAQVPAKSEGKCAVSFSPDPENMGAVGSVVSAKLFVACSSKPGLPPFVFYLKGTVTGEAGGGGKKK